MHPQDAPSTLLPLPLSRTAWPFRGKSDQQFQFHMGTSPARQGCRKSQAGVGGRSRLWAGFAEGGGAGAGPTRAGEKSTGLGGHLHWGGSHSVPPAGWSPSLRLTRGMRGSPPPCSTLQVCEHASVDRSQPSLCELCICDVRNRRII